MDINPWIVDSVQAFSCLKCPECHFYTKEETYFQNHAMSDHPLSAMLFGKVQKKYEEYNHNLVETEDPLDVSDEQGQTTNQTWYVTPSTENILRLSVETITQNRTKGLKCNSTDDQKQLHEKFSRKRNLVGEENQIKRAKKSEIGEILENKGLKGHPVSDMDPIHEGKKLDSNLEQKKETQRKSVPANKNEYMFKCAKCNISFPNIEDLEKHITSVHEEKKQFSGPVSELDNSKPVPVSPRYFVTSLLLNDITNFFELQINLQFLIPNIETDQSQN